jgi:hypothetical protein
MTHRVLALLVCFLFATQALAVVPTILAASAAEHADMTSEHCAGMSAPAEKTRHCPHCQDLATSSFGCASYCAVALPSAPVVLIAVEGTVEFPRSSVPALLTRSDSPPTPPPIR